MQNILQDKFLAKTKTLGTFFELGSATAAECLGLTGLDFFIIDAEHGPFDAESAASFIRAAQARPIAPLVRVKEISRCAVLKMLDIGAAGLIVPCVSTMEEIHNLIRWAKYPPIGKRGFFMARPAGYGFDPIAKNVKDYFDACNQHALLIPQCETVGCLEHIEEIVALQGIDGIFIGPYDLSIDLGIPAEFQHPHFTQAVQRILQACQAAGKLSMIYAGNSAAATKFLDMGFDCVTVSMDASLLVQTYQNLLKDLRR